MKLTPAGLDPDLFVNQTGQKRSIGATEESDGTTTSPKQESWANVASRKIFFTFATTKAVSLKGAKIVCAAKACVTDFD